MDKHSKMKTGSIIFYKNIPSFLSWVQRVVLKTIYSHTSILAGYFQGDPLELEADIKVRLHTYGHSDKYRDIYEPIGVPQPIIDHTIKELKKFEDKWYGFISWFTIFLRRCFEMLGFKNVHKWNILWGWGVICSELVWHYLHDISLAMINDVTWLKFHDELLEFNPNIFTPKDISFLVNKYSSLFKRIK